MEIGVQTGYQIKLAIELAVLLVSSFAARSCGSFAGVAQLVEQLICNHQVGGSNPFTGSSKYIGLQRFSLKPFICNVVGLCQPFCLSGSHRVKSRFLSGRCEVEAGDAVAGKFEPGIFGFL